MQVRAAGVLLALLAGMAACDKPDEEVPQMRAATRPTEAALAIAAQTAKSQPATAATEQPGATTAAAEQFGPTTRQGTADSLANLPAPSGETPGAAVTLPDGLVVQELHVGEGQAVVKGDRVQIGYTAWRTDLRIFDSTRVRKTPSMKFATDTHEVLGKLDAEGVYLPGTGTMEGKKVVIPGLAEGIIGMRPGGARRITIPAALAFGEKGSPPLVPPNTTVTYEVSLVSIEKK